MRIAYVAPYGVVVPSRAAHSVHMVNMAAAIAQLGHEVLFVIPRRSGEKENIFEFYGVTKNFNVVLVPVVPQRWFVPIYSLLTFFTVTRMRTELIVTRSVLCALVCAALRRNVVLDAHGPLWQGRWFYRLAYRWLKNSPHLKHMSFNSRALLDMYADAKQLPGCKVTVAHNGCQPYPSEDKAPAWPGRLGALQVGYTGHLYPGRGVELILDCARRLPSFEFHIIGGSPEDIAFWKKETDATNVHFHGFVSPSVVYRYRNRCDVLLAPYQASGVLSAGGKDDSARYMNPIKLVEYMSSGKAIIASDLAPIRELLNETNAILVDPQDVSAWVKALLTLADPEVRMRFARQARQDFGEQLTWQARARKLIDGAVRP